MTLPARIYECSACYRRYVGDEPSRCGWCGSAVNDIGASTAPFDPLAYRREYEAHPERFGSLGKLVRGLAERRDKAVKSAMLSAATAPPPASKPVTPPATSPAKNTPKGGGELR